MFSTSIAALLTAGRLTGQARAASWVGFIGESKPVGVDVFADSDVSRAFHIDGRIAGRPMQVSVWYPAATGSSGRTPMTVGEYAAFIGTEGRHFADLSRRADSGRRELLDYVLSLGAERGAASALLAATTAARMHARLDTGKHPLVILALGKDDSPALHIALGEYLASRGFVVAALPAMGADARAMRWGVSDVRAELEDLSWLFNRMLQYSGVDPTRVGIVGFSFGVGPALLLAARSNRIAAIVSLDGSIGFRDRVPIYREMRSEFGVVARPTLHINTDDQARNDLSLLDSLVPTALHLQAAGGAHLDFTTLGAAAGFTRGLLARTSSPAPDRVHFASLAATSAFLRAHLMGDASAWALWQQRSDSTLRPTRTPDR